MTDLKPQNNGPKAFAGVLAILAVIGGMAAVVMPMQQQITSLGDIVERHADIRAHPTAREDVATIRAQLTEVETQFRWIREVLEIKSAALERRVHDLEQQIENWRSVPQ